MTKTTIRMDSVEDLSAYRIKRLRRQSDLMQKMTTKPVDADLDALFRNYASLLTVSALVGFAAKVSPIDISKAQEPLGESVQRQFFQADQLKVIDLIAYAHTHEPTVIRSTQKFDIFSGYAAAGFDYFSAKLDAANRDWTSSKTVLECAAVLAEWYLKGSSCFSLTADLANL